MLLEKGILLNNRYRIVEILGQGGMASVYRAIDENLGVEVAVKDNLFTTEDYARQFRREAVILANLRHPNLPRVTDHFVINGQGQYLVMDYIEGEDLRQRMERLGVLEEEEVITIGAAVCDALTYLASRKPPIIHRDIKPGNVKITPQGHIFLVDFGLAKTMQSSQVTTTGARAMTPGFSPPEQYGTARTDHRSDIFSLGSTLYATLTGATPEDALARAMEQAVLAPLRKHNPKVSRKLASVIEKALEVRPDDRYQSAEEFKQALLAVSIENRRRSEDYHVKPPPIEATSSIPEVGEAAHKENVELNHDLVNSNALEKIGEAKPGRRSSAGRRRFYSIFFMIILMLVLGGIVGLYVYYPTLSMQVVAQLRPVIFPGIYKSTPTETRAVMSESTVTRISSTFTPTMIPVMIETTQILPIEVKETSTDTAIPIEKPLPTKTPTPIPTPLGGVGKVAFAASDSGIPQIYVINTDGSGLRQITNMPEGACQPSWSPDATRLIFTSPCEGNLEFYYGSSLYIINLDGTGLLPLPTMAGGDFDPAWSPDGKRIAFTSFRNNGRPQIYFYTLEDNSIQSLSMLTNHDFQPSWSWDGSKLIFISTRRGSDQIWVMDANGDNQEQLSHSLTVINSDPSWSPDGKQVIFTQLLATNGIPRIMIAAYVPVTNTFKEYWVTKELIPMREAVFSPDGYWIAYEGWDPGGPHDIYVVASSGAGRQRVTNTPAYDFDVAWCPVIIP